MRSLNIRNFWKELNVQFQFSHLTGKNYKSLYEHVLLLYRTPAPFTVRDEQQTSHKATRHETKALTYGPEILGSLPSYQILQYEWGKDLPMGQLHSNNTISPHCQNSSQEFIGNLAALLPFLVGRKQIGQPDHRH